MTTQETNTTENNNVVVDDQASYNEYIVECATAGVAPKTFHQWKNQGNIVLPGATVKKSEKQQKEHVIGKADIGRQIFSEELQKVGYDLAKLVRKDVIKRYTTDTLFEQNGLEPLTAAGAATYYANNVAKFRKDPQVFILPESSDESEETTDEVIDEDIQDQVEDEIGEESTDIEMPDLDEVEA